MYKSEFSHLEDVAEQSDARLEKSGEFSRLRDIITDEISALKDKRKALQELDLFVLDNSLRESTVGQVRGHTLQNKWDILEEVKKCGFEHIIVSAFSHARRVDDEFVKELSERESDMSRFYAFSEIGEGAGKKELPISLKKMKKNHLQNPIFEIDLEHCDIARGEEICALLKERFEYAFKELCSDAKIFVNLRDFPFAMIRCPDLVFRVVRFLARMPADERPIGIMFEEPTGRFLPEMMGAWTKAIRTLMNDFNWDGKLLAHVHKKWEFAEVVQLECLSNGANGIWSSICEEGAALGHACSIVSIMNLVRMGNKKVLSKYDCKKLREAAINITKLTTGFPPHPKQAIYGSRALDVAFGFGGIAGGEVGTHEFDVAKFFGIDPPQRMSTLSSIDMIKERLVDLFEECELFTDEIAAKMQDLMRKDLTTNRKEEYMSYVGLALLFDRAGGSITPKMREKIDKVDVKTDRHKKLLAEVRKEWDEWDLTEDEQNDECLGFHAFYNGFMAPYFGCYECDDSRKGLQALDMNRDEKIDWNEFCVYLKWALREYPETDSVEELLTTAFTRGLIPAMQDEILKKETKNKIKA